MTFCCSLEWAWILYPYPTGMLCSIRDTQEAAETENRIAKYNSSICEQILLTVPFNYLMLILFKQALYSGTLAL